MTREIEILPYSSDSGIQVTWEMGFSIETKIIDNEVIIKSNAAGLISLARHLITLAQEAVPEGTHLHFDEFNSLEENSCELIFEKMH